MDRTNFSNAQGDNLTRQDLKKKLKEQAESKKKVEVLVESANKVKEQIKTILEENKNLSKIQEFQKEENLDDMLEKYDNNVERMKADAMKDKDKKIINVPVSYYGHIGRENTRKEFTDYVKKCIEIRDNLIKIVKDEKIVQGKKVVKNLEKEVSNLKETVETLKEETEKVLERKNEEINKLQEIINGEQRKYKEMKGHFDFRIKEEQDKSDKERKEHNKEIQNQASTIVKLKQEKDHLNRDNDAKAQEIKKLIQEKKRLEDENRKLEEKRQELRKNIDYTKVFGDS